MMPGKNPSQRTLNRFREHPNLSVVERRDFVDALKGPGVLAECGDQFCDWAGWFPENEIVHPL